MEKIYTEEDLRQAFYKGREQGKLPDEKGSVMFIRPTFNGYLRELEGSEDPHENWKFRVQHMIDDTDYDLDQWKAAKLMKDYINKIKE